MTRRDFFPSLGAAAAAPAALASGAAVTPRKGRLKQGVTRGCFGRKMELEEMCRHAARLGATGFDLIGVSDWPVLKKYGLLPTMVPGAMKLTDGTNEKANHPAIEAAFKDLIPKAAAAGAPNIIALSGNRRGMSDEQGLENTVLILNKVKALAEDKGVTICLELLNSKVNHPDYMCDRTQWGVEVCKRVGSPRVKLLYDIYHMQIMEGDIIRTIKDNFQWIGHFHTAGNPGRHEFDLETQELNYRGICKVIADLGYQGWLVHEYSPQRDALKSLDEMMSICEV
jgi:hydroxypyruvate isomerase